MKNFQFIISTDDINGDIVTVPKELIHRIKTVLRYKKGDAVRLLVPRTKEHPGKKINGLIDSISDKGVTVMIQGYEPTKESPLCTTLYLSLIKSRHFEDALKKATELGVNRIVPLKTERAVVKISGADRAKKMARWESVVLTAASQCKRDDLPVITDIMSVHELGDVADDAEVKIVCDETSGRYLKDHLVCFPDPVAVSAAIGPEGGFTGKETEMLSRLGFEPVLLVKNILRAETVPLFLLSVIQYEFGKG